MRHLALGHSARCALALAVFGELASGIGGSSGKHRLRGGVIAATWSTP